MIRAERQPDHIRDSQTQQAAIATIENKPLWLVSLQHGQLMAQGDDLGLQYSLAAKAHEKGIEQH